VDQGNFASEPFKFMSGHWLSLRVARTPAASHGAIRFHIEGSEDTTHWTEVFSGFVSSDEEVEVPLDAQAGPWRRVRIDAIGGGGSVIVRGFRDSHDS